MLKIYVASSWRNEKQDNVVSQLRQAGYEVYDFKNPPKGTGFGWHHVDPAWQTWTGEEYRANLLHPTAEAGFKSDFDAMQWADVCVMVMPCGRSAHTEIGWMAGAGKFTIALWNNEEPELMAKIFDAICVDVAEVLWVLGMYKGHVEREQYQKEQFANFIQKILAIVSDELEL